MTRNEQYRHLETAGYFVPSSEAAILDYDDKYYVRVRRGALKTMIYDGKIHLIDFRFDKAFTLFIRNCFYNLIPYTILEDCGFNEKGYPPNTPFCIYAVSQFLRAYSDGKLNLKGLIKDSETGLVNINGPVYTKVTEEKINAEYMDSFINSRDVEKDKVDLFQRTEYIYAHLLTKKEELLEILGEFTHPHKKPKQLTDATKNERLLDMDIGSIDFLFSRKATNFIERYAAFFQKMHEFEAYVKVLSKDVPKFVEKSKSCIAFRQILCTNTNEHGFYTTLITIANPKKQFKKKKK